MAFWALDGVEMRLLVMLKKRGEAVNLVMR